MAEKKRRLSFWENYYTPMKRIKDRRKRADYALKILEYAFDGIEPELDEMEGMAFDSISSLIDDDMNGNKGGRPPSNDKGSSSSPKTKPKTPVKTSLKTSFETSEQTSPYEKKVIEGNRTEKKGIEEAPSLPPLDDHDSEAAAFAVEALEAFNAITQSDIRDMPGDAWCGLRRIFEAGRTIDDVRVVVAKKNAEWRDDAKMAKFVRPSTLFGEKFDEYLNQKDEGGPDDEEVSEYAGLF